jgi:amino acid transporter
LSNKQIFRKKQIGDILKEVSLSDKGGMKRNLKLRDLTAMGIAAIVGAGIFSTIGTASSYGGPAVSLLFVFTAIACGFSAMCYAEFASRVPVSGSAYTYAYASFGELVAWIIGWDLIMEYAVGNIAVAISWSDYFTALMTGFGLHFPEWLGMDYASAHAGFIEVTAKLSQGIPLSEFSAHLQQAFHAWSNAPTIMGMHFILDLPAFIIVVLITCLVFVGIYETKVANNIMVLIKLIILMVIIGVGAFWVNPENWNPFAPNGMGGVMKGVAGVFFAYIGFDAISTTAEECENPQRDLPRSMILSLFITTILYVLISLVLTGMVHYSELAVGDPLAFVFEKVGLTKFSGVIAISALIAMTGVLLVFQVGQPRIWMSMSRDGLLPKRFSRLHPRFRTPAFATIIAGIFVAVPSLFLNLNAVTDLTSIGTLFAFVLVSGGILLLKTETKEERTKGFRVPYINSRYFLLPSWFVIMALVIMLNKEGFLGFFSFQPDASVQFIHKIPLLIFVIIALVVTFLAVVKQWSIIPVIGLLINLYLMTELGITNWMRFLVWLVIGLALYFSYGYWRSKLRNAS